MSIVLIDTGCIVALLDRREKYHTSAAEIVSTLTIPLVTCEAVISESCFLLRHIPAACDRIMQNVQEGIFQIAFDLQYEATRVRELMKRYAKVPMSFADACLVCLAEEFGTQKILTLDRDFLIYRAAKNLSFVNLINLC